MSSAADAFGFPLLTDFVGPCPEPLFAENSGTKRSRYFDRMKKRVRTSRWIESISQSVGRSVIRVVELLRSIPIPRNMGCFVPSDPNKEMAGEKYIMAVFFLLKKKKAAQ